MGLNRMALGSCRLADSERGGVDCLGRKEKKKTFVVLWWLMRVGFLNRTPIKLQSAILMIHVVSIAQGYLFSRACFLSLNRDILPGVNRVAEAFSWAPERNVSATMRVHHIPKRSSRMKAFGFGYGCDSMIWHEKGLPVTRLILRFTSEREEEMKRRVNESGHFAHTVIKSGTGFRVTWKLRRGIITRLIL